MNTIYDGTFVLGSTSATTFSAGNGITITQPSEGVVEIANDETVLYDNPTNHNVDNAAEFIMNESLWNFHRAFIVFDNMEYTGQPVNMEIDLDVSNTDTVYCTTMRNAGDYPALNIPFAKFYINSSGNIKYFNRGLVYNTWTSPLVTTGELRGYRVRKVIGINRKTNA